MKPLARLFMVAIIMLMTLLTGVTSSKAASVDCTDTTTTGIPQVECEALVAIYNSTNGPGWTNAATNNWLTPSAVSTWTGVVVSSGHVSGMLNLSYNNLSGPIPREVGNLTGVDYFYFRNNNLTGNIPPEIAGVNNLIYFYLNNNELTGEIPAQLFSQPNIQDIVLYGNHLSGQIPPEIGNATNLRRFMVHNNDLTGELPTTIGGLTHLTHFSVDGNDLFGQLPAGMASWSTSMSQLTLGNSGFWTTDAALKTYLDTVAPGWDTVLYSQALEPSNHDSVGWGKLADSPQFAPRLVFSKFFNRDGVASSKYRVSVYTSGDIKILEKELTDAAVCPAGGAEITAVCTYAPAWSDFTSPVTTGSYYWTVSTWSGSNWDYSDNNHQFEIVTPPNVEYPTNTTTRVNPTFKWSPVVNALGYNLWVMDSLSAVVLDQYVEPSFCTASQCVYAPTTAKLTLSNGTYTWMVRAQMGIEDYTDWGDASFQKVAAPSPLFPSKSSTMPNPKFTWKPAPDHTNYQIKLVTSSNAPIMNMIVACTSTIVCSYAPTTAMLNLGNGGYKWQVRASDGVEWGTYSPYKTFNKVAPPAPITPTGSITMTNPKFTWKMIPGATKYYIVLQKSSGVLVKNMEVKTPSCNATTCSYTPSPVLNLAKGQYKWKVRAFNGYYGPYGAYMNFTKK